MQQSPEWHPGCNHRSGGYATIDGDSYCGDPIHERAAEIRRLAWEQRMDDRSTISHANDGRTGTLRIGSEWVQRLPETEGVGTTKGGAGVDRWAGPGGGQQSIWSEPDEDQLALGESLDAVLASLTDYERGLILLRFENNVPLREIGDRVGTSKDTVSRELDRLMERIRQAITQVTGESGYHEARAALVRLGGMTTDDLPDDLPLQRRAVREPHPAS
jgi:RNA polymerase sigma factor (sigma-70 family)